jgi:hypothetical protein
MESNNRYADMLQDIESRACRVMFLLGNSTRPAAPLPRTINFALPHPHHHTTPTRLKTPTNRYDRPGCSTLSLLTFMLLQSMRSKRWKVTERIRSEVLTVVIIFWDVVPCSLVEVYRHFRGMYSLHLQGERVIRVLCSMEAICSSKATVNFCRTTPSHVP